MSAALAGPSRSALRSFASGRAPRDALPRRRRSLHDPQTQCSIAEQPAAAVDRRGVLAMAAAAAVGAVPALPAAAAPAAAPQAPPSPDVVPPLTETYISPEGFAFDYPAGWVVAFDRSNSTGNGAVVVVGDFRQLITVSVFRTESIDAGLLESGLGVESGYDVCVRPQQQQPSTMRFQLLRSQTVEPAAGSSPGSKQAYEFEFDIETCAGEIEEGMGGKLRCLSFGAVIPSQRRRHIGRCVLARGRAYTLNASSPEDRWAQVGPIVQAVANTFRS